MALTEGERMDRLKNIVFTAVSKKIRSLFFLFIIFLLFFCNITMISIGNNNDLPDLVIQSVDIPDKVIEADNVHIEVLIKNKGNKDIAPGEIIEVELEVNNKIVCMNSSNRGLSADASDYINLSWVAELGDGAYQMLQIAVDPDNFIIEKDETNNNIHIQVEVIERNTDITFGDEAVYLSRNPRVGESVTIFTNVTNIGKNTGKDINVTLYIKDVFYQSKLIKGLAKGHSVILAFEWTPQSFGSDIILNITLDPKDTIDEQDETNNYNETKVDVRMSRLQWWDPNWHYRRFYDVSGEGNISVEMNFTEILQDLDVAGKNFENDTITVVKYYKNGTIAGIIDKYNFNESDNFNDVTNAFGILFWEMTGSAYYCVYYDVVQNNGTREGIPETEDMVSTGNSIIEFLPEGWWTVLTLEPYNNFYNPNKIIDIYVETKAKSKNVTAKLFLEDSPEDNVSLDNIENSTQWHGIYYLNKIGNWSIRILAYDDAEYQAEITEYDFYVGYPDLTITSLDFYTDSQHGSTFYESTNITIEAIILVYNTTVHNVTVNLSIKGKEVDSDSKIIPTVLIDEENIVNFYWIAEPKGLYNVSIMVDPEDKIDEGPQNQNEQNNELYRDLIVEGIPDLGVVGVSFPSQPVNEGEQVAISTVINNKGEGNASDYRINLYLEQNKNNIMHYDPKDIFNHTYISVKINETKSVDLIWSPAYYGIGGFKGEWIVGVKICYDDSHPDLNIFNNSYSPLNKRLKVNESESNKPEITILRPVTDYEQGEHVEILAKITDESGIKKVDIAIKDPKNETFEGKMIKEQNDRYSYIFKETNHIGTYNFSITAEDNSFRKNHDTVYRNFKIVPDASPPIIEYLKVHPKVQLPNDYVTISSIVTDFSGISSVQVKITYPNNEIETKTMTNTSGSNKYVYRHIYETIGKYEIYITVEDTLGIKTTTEQEPKEFWITTDLDDTDNDGMPDWWEEKYGFDPYDPSDANQDEDDDGYNNVEEFKNGTDPLERFSFLQTIVFTLKESWEYLFVSVALFLITLALSIYGIRRQKK